MTSAVFKLLFLLSGISSFAQTSVTVSFADTAGKPIPAVEVYNKTTGEKFVSNAAGTCRIPVSDTSKKYDFAFYKENYALAEQQLSASASPVTISLQAIETLSEVTIQKQKEKIFALNHLRDIEETAIYAGKKTESISIDKLTANKATNNARQVYSQIVGLTINESSDGGLQLSIGGRGLNPNRSSNFNTRQNGYDISADVLGYPESYYTPPVEALSEIQVVRGAASLQYGTQFGGLVNFKFREPSAKPLEIQTRNTVGSYGLFTNFTSLSGTKGKFSYYTFFNYKQGDGFRPNSGFSSRNFFVNLNYKFNDKTSLHFDYTMFDYLEQQAGGLTDVMFNEDPKQSNRTRNWFAVNWNLFALRLKHKFTDKADFSLQLFGLDASRKALGFRSNRVSTPDVAGTERDLVTGDFVNWGAEARFLQKYTINAKTSALLIGAKFYEARNKAQQGPGSSGSGPDFHFADSEFPFYRNQSQYAYPNLNVAIFGENIVQITDKFSITPGFRFEEIRTKADGFYRTINTDLAGNVILDQTVNENVVKDRNFVLFGIGLSYKPKTGLECYGNVSQNYRSVTFNDIHTYNAGQAIDPNITDEKGYTSDIGVRGRFSDKVSFDASVYGLYYNDKIGDYPTVDAANRYVLYRSNIGTALTYGFEALADWKLDKTFFESDDFSWNLFANVAFTGSKYLKSNGDAHIEGNKVEFVPLVNLRTGTGIGYKNFLSSLQLTYVSEQFTDATNAKTDPNDDNFGITGQIPAYYVADFSVSYKWRKWKLEGGVNNFTNHWYFTRRATGYPGPGIIPSDPRTFYTTLEFTF
jgi:Fe(3+) dicitrate transport protein